MSQWPRAGPSPQPRCQVGKCPTVVHRDSTGHSPPGQPDQWQPEGFPRCDQKWLSKLILGNWGPEFSWIECTILYLFYNYYKLWLYAIYIYIQYAIVMSQETSWGSFNSEAAVAKAPFWTLTWLRHLLKAGTKHHCIHSVSHALLQTAVNLSESPHVRATWGRSDWGSALHFID